MGIPATVGKFLSADFLGTRAGQRGPFLAKTQAPTSARGGYSTQAPTSNVWLFDTGTNVKHVAMRHRHRRQTCCFFDYEAECFFDYGAECFFDFGQAIQGN